MGSVMDAIQKLKHNHIIILYRFFLGESQTKIANDMGMSERHISRITNSPVFREEFNKLSDDLREKIINNSKEVREIFNAASPDAARKLVELMHTAPEPKDQIKAADKIIGHSDYSANKVEVVKASYTLTEEKRKLIEECITEKDEGNENVERLEKYQIQRDFSDYY